MFWTPVYTVWKARMLSWVVALPIVDIVVRVFLRWHVLLLDSVLSTVSRSTLGRLLETTINHQSLQTTTWPNVVLKFWKFETRHVKMWNLSHYNRTFITWKPELCHVIMWDLTCHILTWDWFRYNLKYIAENVKFDHVSQNLLREEIWQLFPTVLFSSFCEWIMCGSYKK